MRKPTSGPTSIRVPEELQNRMQMHSKVSIAQQFITAFTILEKIRFYSEQELRTKFTQNEWKLMAECLHADMFTMEAHYAPQEMIRSIQSQDLYNDVGSKYGVNIEKLCEKIERLTAAQLDALYNRIQTFWDVSEEKYEPDSEEFNNFLERWSKF